MQTIVNLVQAGNVCRKSPSSTASSQARQGLGDLSRSRALIIGSKHAYFLEPDRKRPEVFSLLRGHFDAHFENGGRRRARGARIEWFISLLHGTEIERFASLSDMPRRMLIGKIFAVLETIAICLFWTLGQLPPSPCPDSTTATVPQPSPRQEIEDFED